MRKNIIFSIFFIFLILAMSGISSDAKTINIGEKIPELKAETWINGDLSTKNLKFHPLVIEFWASWCPPCRKVIPHMVKLYQKYSKKGIIFIGFTKEPYIKVKSFISEYKIEYNIGTGSSDTFKKFRVDAIPVVFVIGYDGNVLWSGHPGDNKFEYYIKKSIKGISDEARKSFNIKSSKEVKLKDVKKK